MSLKGIIRRLNKGENAAIVKIAQEKAAKRAKLYRNRRGLPPVVDLRQGMPPIWDQGNLGSSSAHAAAYAIAHGSHHTPSQAR